MLLRILVAEGEVPVGHGGRRDRRGGRGGAGRGRRRPAEEAAGAGPRRRPPSRARRSRLRRAGPRCPRRPPGAPGAGRRAGQGLAARPPDRARARDRSRPGSRGTGPEGRIVAEDVERAEAASAPAPRRPPCRRAAARAVERVELTSLRRTIARRMTEAWAAPAFQISMSADMTARPGAACAPRRASSRRAADRHRRPDQGLRGRADAPPRGERDTSPATRSSCTRRPNVGIAVAHRARAARAGRPRVRAR